MRIAYKGFNSKLCARLGRGTYQFEIGKTAKEEKADCARTGFHCAEEPFDVLDYYGATSDRYCIVAPGGDVHEDAYGSRISCTELTLVKEISRRELAIEECKFLYEHPHRKYSNRVKKDKGEADCYFVLVRGKKPKAKGKKGTVLLLLREEPDNCEIAEVGIYEVDGKEIKADVYYGIDGKAAKDD